MIEGRFVVRIVQSALRGALRPEDSVDSKDRKKGQPKSKNRQFLESCKDGLWNSSVVQVLQVYVELKAPPLEGVTFGDL